MSEGSETDWSDVVRSVAVKIFRDGFITLDELTDLVDQPDLEDISDFLDALEKQGIVFEQLTDDQWVSGDTSLVPKAFKPRST